MINPRLKSLIPKIFFDTHLHAPFPKIPENVDYSKWRKGSMLSGYFFDSGLHLKSLEKLYPFENRLKGVAIPIPYGPFDPLDVNESAIKNEIKVKDLLVTLLGEVAKKDLEVLKRQIVSSKKVVGLKFYQHYKKKSTTVFLKKVLYKEICKLANDYGLVLIIHTNNLTGRSLEFLESVLLKYRKIKIVLSHGAVKLRGYFSFDFKERRQLMDATISVGLLEKEKTRLFNYMKKVRRILRIPRLYVNTAFLTEDISLYPIVKFLAPAGRVVYGSDLPFAYANRVVSERLPYENSVHILRSIYEGRDVGAERYYENLLFFLERIMFVSDFVDSSKTKDVFNSILYETPKKVFG